MSKKYKEELDKIVMNEEMKKRILNNVLNENGQAKMQKTKKNYILKRNLQIIAACFTAVICFSSAKNFMQQNRNLPQQIYQNTYDKNKDLHNSEKSKNHDNEESNNSVQKQQNIQQHSSVDQNSQKNKSEKYNHENKSLYDNENPSEKKGGNLSNTELKPQVNSNTGVINSGNLENQKNDSHEVAGGNPIKEYKTIEEAEEEVKFKINNIKVLPSKFNIGNICVISDEIIQIEYNNENNKINFRAGKSVNNVSGDYNKYEFQKKLKLKDKCVSLKGHRDGMINLALWQIGDISYSLSSVEGIKEETISEMIKISK